jgi:tetratricopeptide (TPR) repeat protein
MTRTTTAALAALAALAVCLGACASNTSRRADNDAAATTPSERVREAERLAAEADRARRDGRSDEAIDLYRSSIEYSADFPDVWNNLGLLLLERGEPDKAISAFSMASELNPTDPRPITNIGITNLRVGWAEDAIDDFHRALEITPSYLPALRGSIRAADLLGRAEYEDLDRIRRALLAERDEDWRAYLERQRFLLESRLRSSGDAAGPTTFRAARPRGSRVRSARSSRA